MGERVAEEGKVCFGGDEDGKAAAAGTCVPAGVGTEAA